MRPGILIFWGIVVAIVYNAVMQYLASRRAKRAEEEANVTAAAARETRAMLAVWANTWPDMKVRVELQAAMLKEQVRESRRTSGTELMGCELCLPENLQWWFDNGYTQTQRDQWCQINCPPVEQ